MTLFKMEQCLAITNAHVRCKNVTKKGYCQCHYYSHAIYKNAPEWPTMAQVRKSIKKVENLDDLNNSLKNLKWSGTVLEKRKTLIVISESLLKYRILYFEDLSFPSWGNLIKIVISKFDGFDHLDDYLLHFRKKVDKEYRLIAQKKYINYIICHSELGQDIAGVICGFL